MYSLYNWKTAKEKIKAMVLDGNTKDGIDLNTTSIIQV